jgi:glucosamine--fructose-6-phosphate aminotransferase (isomerizing)
MCGIVGVLRRPGTAAAPGLPDLVSRACAPDLEPDPSVDALASCAEALGYVDRKLRGPAGARALIGDPVSARALADRVADVERWVVEVENHLDRAAPATGPEQVEAFNAGIVAVRDAAWALGHDRLRVAEAVSAMAGDVPDHAVDAYWSIEIALAALDRLEIRGRDSAGLLVTVSQSGIVPDDEAFGERSNPGFTSGAVRVWPGLAAFVFKTASTIG